MNTLSPISPYVLPQAIYESPKLQFGPINQLVQPHHLNLNTSQTTPSKYQANQISRRRCTPSEHRKLKSKLNLRTMYEDDSDLSSQLPSSLEQDSLENSKTPSSVLENDPSKLVSRQNKCHSQIEQIWKENDDKLLFDITIKFRHDWKKINQVFQAESGHKSTPVYLKKRYSEIRGRYETVKRRALSKEDDERILKAVQDNNYCWKEIYEALADIDPIQIRNRYYFKLRNSIKQ